MEIDGIRMLIGLVIGITLLIMLVLKTKVQTFLALIISTIMIGIIGGMPLTPTDVVDAAGDARAGVSIINSITSGFGGTLGSIGIIIGFGVMMGQVFDISGAAKRMAYTFLKLFGKGREEEALALTGFLVSIPIFCDSGFIVLSPIAKALSNITKKSVIGLGVSLAAGLVITHSLVPPTPGPLGVCGIFNIDVGNFILLTIALALPMIIACIIYAKKYPSTFTSFLPLVLPIILILINTIASALKLTGLFWKIMIFLGQPIVAVGISLLVAVFTLGHTFSRDTILHEMEKGMASAGVIILVTGGGGALGRIITDSGLGGYIANGLAGSNIPLILLPLAISTLMRFIQGSGTVAMTTAASITAPILIASDTVNPVLGAIACCVGSLFFGYFNDSYFWVVNRTLGVSDGGDQLRVWSATSTIAWAVGVVEVLILSIFMH